MAATVTPSITAPPATTPSVTTPLATAPQDTAVVAQPSLLGIGRPSFDAGFVGIERHRLGRGAWVDHRRGWLDGHQTLFDQLMERVAWSRQRRPMYDRMVDVPRLIGALPDDLPEAGLGIVADMAAALGRRYGTPFDRIGVALYRNGADSVAWHGDQVAREMAEALVATVSLGEPRTFALRPKGGGTSKRFRLGHGDLVVMGGSCQRTWEHTVPKVARAGPRIALMFRPTWSSSEPRQWLPLVS